MLYFFLCCWSQPSVSDSSKPSKLQERTSSTNSASEEPIKPSPQVVAIARSRTLLPITYDPAYFKLKYPMGDPPPNKGVCTDLIIRTYRKLGVDLQVLVHEDMSNRFEEYPQIWGLKKPDSNIDHRRVPNLQTFFDAYAQQHSIEDVAAFEPGNIVIWKLPTGQFHIGFVSDQKTRSTPKIIHNIGGGPKEESGLFNWEIIRNYSYPI